MRCRTCSTAGASAARSTWPATASAMAATATSTIRCRTRSPSCAAPSTGIWRRSPTTGRGCCVATNRTFPLEHDELLEQCRAAGQERPTPLILRYGEGDWNALHQDLYGDVYFPFQILTVALRARRRLRGRRVRADGAAPAGAEPRARAQAAARRVRDLPDAASARTAAATATTASGCGTASGPSRAAGGPRWASSSTTPGDRLGALVPAPWDVGAGEVHAADPAVDAVEGDVVGARRRAPRGRHR